MDTGWALLCHKADFLSLTTGVCYPLLLRQSVAYFIPLCFNFSFHGDNRTAHHMVAENYIRECIQVLRALLSTEPLPHNKFQLIMYMYVKYICISLSLIKDVSFSLGVGMQHSAPGTCAASTTPGWDLSTTNSRSAGVCLLHITQQEGHEFKVTFTCKWSLRPAWVKSPCLRSQAFTYQLGVNFFIEDSFIFDEGHSLSKSAGRDGLLRKTMK